MDTSYYIFTDENGKYLDKVTITGSSTPGTEALKFRVNLQKKLGDNVKVLAWAHMGGDNPNPEPKVKKTP